MNTLITSILFCSLCASASVAGAPQPSNEPADINAIKKLEQDMGDAMVRVDTNRLGQIYADDFVTVGSSGKVITKKDLLGDFEAFHDKLVSFENGPVEVQVFGNVAVAHGSVSEKRTRDGKDVSGEFVWMDLLEKRAGKWVVLRSAGSRLK
jgi:ketosteroid isomerase-like protein